MRGSRRAVIAVALLIALGSLVAVMGTGSSGRSGPVQIPSTTPTSTLDVASEFATIARSDLPPEARTTLALIAAGGPFPYGSDGAVFENRERLLPLRPSGAYREYTVETPGSPDRGARRIITAPTGEAYWTADHYASFARILP